jgi:hypothetical protein
MRQTIARSLYNADESSLGWRWKTHTELGFHGCGWFARTDAQGGATGAQGPKGHTGDADFGGERLAVG